MSATVHPVRAASQHPKHKPVCKVVKFAKDKDTPGTIRYAEIVPDDDMARVKNVYLQKSLGAALLGDS